MAAPFMPASPGGFGIGDHPATGDLLAHKIQVSAALRAEDGRIAPVFLSGSSIRRDCEAVRGHSSAGSGDETAVPCVPAGWEREGARVPKGAPDGCSRSGLGLERRWPVP